MRQEEHIRSDHVVPALPGFFVLTPVTGDNDEIVELWDEPVIAWRITLEGTAEQRRAGRDYAIADPITAEGIDSRDTAAILRPDGKVISPHIGCWNSKNEYLAHLREEHSKNKQPRAA